MKSLITRLQLVLGAICLTSLVLAVALVWAVMTERNVTRQIDSVRSQGALVEKINGLVYAVVMESRGVYMSDKADVLERFAKNLEAQLGDLGKAVTAWSALIGDEDKADFATFTASYKTFDTLRRELAQAGRTGGSQAARVVGDNEANRSVRIAFNAAIKVLADRFDRRADALYALSETRAQATLAFAVALGSFVVLVAAFSFFYIRRSVARPVQRLTRAIQKLATGDTDADVPVLNRNDEIGAIAAAVLVFKDNAVARQRLEHETRETYQAQLDRSAYLETAISSFEESVGGVIQMVASASTQMDAAAQSLGATAQEAVELTTSISAATTEAAVSVQAVAAASDQLSQSIAEITSQISSSSSIAEEAVNEAGATANHFVALAESANRIGNVLQIITNIAEQTNLLALNATIEAARAGESGRGFAVVAAEVKTLAQQTASATQDIAAQITAMQDAMRNVDTALTSIGDTIVRVRDNGTAIAAAVEEQSFATAEISKNVQEAANGTEDVSRNLVGVTGATQATNAASTQLMGMARELASQSALLRERMNGFVETVRAA